MRGATLTWVWLGAVAATGCAGGRVQSVAIPIPLATPAPPPRVVVAQPLDPAEPPAPVATPATPPEVTPPTRRPSAPRPTEKPEPPPATAIPPDPPPAAPGPNRLALEQPTRRLLTEAGRDLDTIANARTLGPEAQAHFQRARGLMALAERALRDQDYRFAERCAKNAAEIAAALRRFSGPISS